MNNQKLKWSIRLNMVLAASLVLLLVKHLISTDPQVAPPAEPTPATTAPPAQPSSPPSAPSQVQMPFHWSQVESADYQIYIANLRQIGCPEETIRDIIKADVESLFAPRYAALSDSAPELSWWGRFDSRKPLRTDLMAKLNALNEEKKALLTRLLGPAAGVDLAFIETHVSDLREAGLFAFLPANKQAAARDLFKRYQALRESNASRWKSLPAEERNALEKELRDSLHRELASLLTPEELREFEVRDSPAANLLRDLYGRADLNEEEFRAMYELRRDLEQRNPEPSGEDWEALKDAYAARLGPERFNDIQRQNDSMWRAMQYLADNSGFTPDAMSQAFDLKEDYRAQLALAAGDMFADPQQNPQPLRDIAAEMTRDLTAVLGPEGVAQLDRLGVLPRMIITDDGVRKSFTLSRSTFDQ